MKLTNRQATLLANLRRLVVRRKASGRIGYFLDKEDCSSTIISLLVKGAIMHTDDGKGLRAVETG